MEIANSRLSPQVLTIEAAENLLREIAKDELFLKITRKQADEKAKAVIRAALLKISIPSLREVTWRSLLNFYNTQRRIAREIGATRLFAFLALASLVTARDNKGASSNVDYRAYMSAREAKDVIRRTFPREADEILTFGQPLDMYHEAYMKEYIKPTLDRMARERALDPEAPGYIGRRMSLMARAELEVRYDFHQKQIAEFKARGVKLVVVSSHADCSERCFPWQGRVYSLDGTYGTAPDGRPFIPLEIATNVLTPNGKWYNGLFGFGCRHYMREYKDGLTFPNVSNKETKKQYYITQKQRRLEREIRRARVNAVMAKGVDPDEYKRQKTRAEMLYRAYKSYSKKNHRAYYPSRTKIL